MNPRSFTGVVIVLFTSILGCATGTAPIYQDSLVTIRIEPNPAAKAATPGELDARAVTKDQLSAALRGLVARKKDSVLQYVVGSRQIGAVFPEEQISLLSGELLKGCMKAGAEERVAFQLWRTSAKGFRDETTGALYLRGQLLYISVDKFRVPARMSYEAAEVGSGKDFELLFDPADAVVEQQQSFATRWFGGHRPEVTIDLQRVSTLSNKPVSISPGAVGATGAAGVLPSAPRQEVSTQMPGSLQPARDARSVETLQQQIKVLTEANEKLMKGSSQTQEELNRLRQELVETKQLLADKVLELNRLNSKPGGANKEKP
jgi:hypothetical protein